MTNPRTLNPYIGAVSDEMHMDFLSRNPQVLGMIRVTYGEVAGEIEYALTLHGIHMGHYTLRGLLDVCIHYFGAD